MLFVLVLSGCLFDTKPQCYEQVLATFKKTSEYKTIIASAQRAILNVLDVNNRKFFVNPLYITSAKIDDAVFLNKVGDKCILVLLQKTTSNLKSDQISILHGALVKGKWQYFANRMPRLPQMTYSIAKPSKGSIHVNNSFKELSEKGREYVLKFGDASSKNCEVDYKFWFGE